MFIDNFIKIYILHHFNETICENSIYLETVSQFNHAKYIDLYGLNIYLFLLNYVID